MCVCVCVRVSQFVFEQIFRAKCVIVYVCILDSGKKELGTQFGETVVGWWVLELSLAWATLHHLSPSLCEFSLLNVEGSGRS